MGIMFRGVLKSRNKHNVLRPNVTQICSRVPVKIEKIEIFSAYINDPHTILHDVKSLYRIIHRCTQRQFGMRYIFENEWWLRSDNVSFE